MSKRASLLNLIDISLEQVFDKNVLVSYHPESIIKNYLLRVVY